MQHLKRFVYLQECDDQIIICDLGDVIDKYNQWVKLMPRVKPFYGMYVNSRFAYRLNPDFLLYFALLPDQRRKYLFLQILFYKKWCTCFLFSLGLQQHIVSFKFKIYICVLLLQKNVSGRVKIIFDFSCNIHLLLCWPRI